jgi:hypothetical protein
MSWIEIPTFSSKETDRKINIVKSNLRHNQHKTRCFFDRPAQGWAHCCLIAMAR